MCRFRRCLSIRKSNSNQSSNSGCKRRMYHNRNIQMCFVSIEPLKVTMINTYGKYHVPFTWLAYGIDKHYDFSAYFSLMCHSLLISRGMVVLWKFFKLKHCLHWQNSHVFGDVFQQVRKVEDRVDEIKIEYDRDPSSKHHDFLHHAQAVLNGPYLLRTFGSKSSVLARCVRRISTLDIFM